MISFKGFASLVPAFAALCVIGVSRAQTSPPTNSLQLWVKADAGVTANATGFVEKWADQSGNGNDATQSDDTLKPKLVTNALSGKPVIRFDGVDDYLDVATSAGLEIIGDLATFAVIRVDDYANFNGVWGKTAANLPAPNDWYIVAGSGISRIYRGDGTGSALQNVDSERPIRPNTYAVLGIRQSGTTLTHY